MIELPALTLPTEDYTPPEINGIPKKFSMIVFGPPKVGKTSFGAEFPNSLILETESEGADEVKCRKVDIEAMKQLRDFYPTLKADTKYDTLIVDSLDKIALWIEEEICKEMGLNTILDAKKGEKHGSQWGEYKARVLGFLAGMTKLEKRVIFLAHTKRAEVDNNGTAINPKTINLYGSAASAVLSIVNNIGYMYAEEVEGGKIKHYLAFCPGSFVEGGARSRALSSQTIHLPKGGAYKAFEALFHPQQAKKAEMPATDPKKKGGKR